MISGLESHATWSLWDGILLLPVIPVLAALRACRLNSRSSHKQDTVAERLAQVDWNICMHLFGGSTYLVSRSSQDAVG